MLCLAVGAGQYLLNPLLRAAIECQLRCCHVLADMLRTGSTDNGTTDLRPPENPGQSKIGQWHAKIIGYGAELANNLKILLGQVTPEPLGLSTVGGPGEAPVFLSGPPPPPPPGPPPPVNPIPSRAHVGRISASIWRSIML